MTLSVQYSSVFDEAGDHNGRVLRDGAHADIAPLNAGEKDFYGVGEHTCGHRVCFSATTFGAGTRLGLEILRDADRSEQVLVATILNANPQAEKLVKVYERHGFRVLEQVSVWSVHMVRHPNRRGSE